MSKEEPKMEDLIKSIDLLASLPTHTKNWAEENKLIASDLLDEQFKKEIKANRLWIDLMKTRQDK